VATYNGHMGRPALALLLTLCASCRSPHPRAPGPPVAAPREPDLGPAPDGGLLPTAFRRGRTTQAPAPRAGDDGPCVVGVPECDEYLGKFYICVSQQVPEPQRAAMEQALRSTCESLRRMALSTAGRPGLSQACRTAMSAARQSMAPFGCTW
jgi:hypothetical protein